MKKDPKHYLIFLFIPLVLLSCKQNGNNNTNISKTVQNDQKINNEVKEPQIYSIKGNDIFIRIGPGEKYSKLINEKLSEALKEKSYSSIDNTVKVIETETKGEWSKIRVVDPEWLSDTFIGWIPTKYIIKNNNIANAKQFEKLDKKLYEIIKTDSKPTVDNFHILIKFTGYNFHNQDKIREFIEKFKKEFCTRNCNINIYDSKSVLTLIDNFQIKDKDYIKLADHFVAISSFDMPESIVWYPFQDFKYKELGGKNWKKEPIK